MITSPLDQPLAPALDRACERIRSADAQQVADGVDALGALLGERRLWQSPDEWRATLAECRRHPVGQLLLDDPLTRRSFTRPRGYAGDAEMLDIIYERTWRGLAPEPTPVGAAIFARTIECRAPSAVRERRAFLAREISAACARRERPDVLSVACGHLRELAQCEAFRAGCLGRFVGLDQDEQSLREVARSLPGAVQAVPGSIKLLFGGELAREQFDLIYSAGLYDYLNEEIASRLTRRMFQMLRPGGRLLIANFCPDIGDRGYMEAFMDWHLIYRDVREMAALAHGVGDGLAGHPKVFPDETGAVLYLQLERAP